MRKLAAVIGLGACLALAGAAHAQGQNADLNERLEPAYIIAAGADRIVIVTPGGGGHAADGMRPFRLDTYFGQNARIENGQSVAWEDIRAGANCQTGAMLFTTVSVHGLEGQNLGTAPLNQTITPNAGTPLRSALELVCGQRTQDQLNPAMRRTRIIAMQTIIAQRAAEAAQ